MAQPSQYSEPRDRATQSPDRPRPKARQEAKTWPVTIVYADIVGSAPLSEELGPDAYKDVIERFQREGRRIIREYGGFARALGDAVIGNFGVKIGIRIGVHTDEAPVAAPSSAPLSNSSEDLRRDDDMDVQGKVVIVASRLQTSAAQGQILIGQGTYQRVRAWVTVDRARPLELKGVGGPVLAWALFTVYSQPRLRL